VGDGLDHGDIMVFDDACSTRRSTGSDPSHGMPRVLAVLAMPGVAMQRSVRDSMSAIIA